MFGLSANSRQSRPMMFWQEEDVWNYIKINNLRYSKIYDMGYDRTGCVFCMFGIMQEKNDRFELLKRTHPKMYNYCMDKLGMAEVLNFIKNGNQVTIGKYIKDELFINLVVVGGNRHESNCS